jgi:hypothetical protein
MLLNRLTECNKLISGFHSRVTVGRLIFSPFFCFPKRKEQRKGQANLMRLLTCAALFFCQIRPVRNHPLFNTFG